MCDRRALGPLSRIIPFRLILSFALLPGAPSWARGAQDSPAATVPEIIVTTPRGRASGGIDPLLEISPSELDSYGVDTLSDLVDALRPLTRSSRSDQMAVVLINGRLAGQIEFDNLPREAIERVEVLPESVALQYGFSENQRVLNFILREHYRGVPLRVSESGATEGGDQAQAADASVARLDDAARITLLASYKDAAWLRDSDRSIDTQGSFYRTLQPATSDAKVAGTVSRALGPVSGSLEASFDLLNTTSLQGESSAMSALEQTAPTRTARVATQITGQLKDFVCGATAYYQHVSVEMASDTGVDPAGNPLVDRTDTAFNVGNVQLSASGPLAALPAGLMIANVKVAFQYQGYDTADAYPGASPASSNLVRTVRSANFNASVPIANRDRGVMPGLNTLSGTFNAAVDSVSNFGSLVSASLGLDWKPRSKVHLDAIYTDHKMAPTVQQLSAPPLYTPNVELFDYVIGQTADVTEITGGNDSLAATDNRQASFGISLGPFIGKTEFLAHYEQSRISHVVGALPPTTADVELAFPDRFIRNAEGDLIEVDDRWVNLARERVDDLKWGVNVWIPLGPSSSNAMANRVEFSLFDTWYLHDVTLIRTGIPALNLLGGAPSDVSGGQPRHKLEFHSLVHENGFGFLLAAAWRSPTVVGSGNPDAPDPIDFSGLATADLRLFADLARLPLTRNENWAKGARISLAVTNLLDTRQTVHDATGATPTAFEPGFLDPPGRVVALTLRKVF